MVLADSNHLDPGAYFCSRLNLHYSWILNVIYIYLSGMATVCWKIYPPSIANSCVEGREVKWFNVIARGEGHWMCLLKHIFNLFFFVNITVTMTRLSSCFFLHFTTGDEYVTEETDIPANLILHKLWWWCYFKL